MLPYRTGESLDYAAEIVFACFRHSFVVEGRVSATALDLTQHAVRSFVSGAVES